MAREIPENLNYFLKNAVKDVDDGYEYSTELRRILNSDGCQASMTSMEIEKLKDFADDVKRVGEFNSYSEDKIKEIERDHFGSTGIKGFLGITDASAKPDWPF